MRSIGCAIAVVCVAMGASACGEKPNSCGKWMTPHSFVVSATVRDDGGTRTFLPDGGVISRDDCQDLCGLEFPEGVTCTPEVGDGGAPIVKIGRAHV